MNGMQIGLMWYEANTAISLETMIEQAAAYYVKKYGSAPNLCWVHPSMMPTEPIASAVEVRADRYVMPRHLWIGVREERAG